MQESNLPGLVDAHDVCPFFKRRVMCVGGASVEKKCPPRGLIRQIILLTYCRAGTPGAVIAFIPQGKEVLLVPGTGVEPAYRVNAPLVWLP
jgi:hypothetical protein